ncbi:hypothetical protein ACHWQZ_G003674 [Mnemiopsis leidyi]
MVGLRNLQHKKNGLTCESESTSSFYIFTPLFVVLGILLFNMFNFVTWNVHGLTQDVKRTLLANDAARYGMEVVCLQETKCTKSEDLILHNGYKLILIEQKLGRHYGLGFVISPKMQKMAKSYSYISDRVAILTLQIRAKSGSIITYRIVNAYGPTLQRAYEHPHELTNFYQSLSTACNVPSRNKSVKDRFDVSKLTCNNDIQQAYQTALSGKINNLDHSAASEPQSSLRKLLDCVKQTAKDVVGTQNALPVRGHWNDAIITNLVEKRKDAMLTLKSCNKSDDRSSIRTLINKTQKSIQARDEVSNNDDIFILKNITEGRVSLRYKNMWGFRYSHEHFNFEYLVKTDDDIIVNLPKLISDLSKYPTGYYYLGRCVNVVGKPPQRWHYCSGGGYVLSRDLVTEIVNLPRTVHRPRMKPEDVFTGWLVWNVNNSTEHSVWPGSIAALGLSRYKCGLFNKWFYHGYKKVNPEDRLEVFRKYFMSNTPFSCSKV